MPAGAPEETGCWQAGTRWTGAAVEGANLRFRPPDAADRAALAALGATPGLLADIPENPAGGVPPGSDEAVFAVLRRVDGAAVGVVAIDRKGGEGFLRCWIAPAFRGLGHGGETVRRLARFAFRELGLAALEAAPARGHTPERIRAHVSGDDAEMIAGSDSEANDGEDVAWRRALDQAGFAAAGPRGARRLEGAAWAEQAARRPNVLVAAAALVDADGRVLVARRPEGRSMAGLWEFPGGKVAEGESPEEALIRELREELGIETRESCLAAYAFASHEYDSFRLLMPLYVCRVWKGAPSPREGQELAWTRPQALAGWPMPPADAPLVALLCDLL